MGLRHCVSAGTHQSGRVKRALQAGLLLLRTQSTDLLCMQDCFASHPKHCLNACNQRGNCTSGFCRCDAGAQPGRLQRSLGPVRLPGPLHLSAKLLLPASLP
eukprot:41873-Chlamydomonas_euryale.AAC.1